MLREVEKLRTGDLVSFRGSGAARYRVRRVEVDGQDVTLYLRASGLDLETKYRTGDLARVHDEV